MHLNHPKLLHKHPAHLASHVTTCEHSLSEPPIGALLYNKNSTQTNIIQKNVGGWMAVPKISETGCRDGSMQVSQDIRTLHK